MTPSVFEGLEAVDETTYCVELGANAEQSLTKHWDSFITRDDFICLANAGINAVRILRS
jgi:glucan 1,3-beta-glucosidase